MMQNDFTKRTNQNLNHVRAMILLADSKLERLMHSTMCHKVTQGHQDVTCVTQVISKFKFSKDLILDTSKS